MSKAAANPLLPALMALSLLAGCATTPDPLRDAVVEPVTVDGVRAAPERYAGLRVRWGGSIVAVRNLADTTVVEVLSRPLKSSAAPKPDAFGTGRFRARVRGFLDPSDYAVDRWFTVVGEVSGAESGLVGEHAYLFPLVEVESHRLWRSREEIEPPPRPYFYDPWWGPWYYPHPWRRDPYWW